MLRANFKHARVIRGNTLINKSIFHLNTGFQNLSRDKININKADFKRGIIKPFLCKRLVTPCP